MHKSVLILTDLTQILCNSRLVRGKQSLMCGSAIVVAREAINDKTFCMFFTGVNICVKIMDVL